MRKLITVLALLISAQAIAADKLTVTDIRRADPKVANGIQGVAHNETQDTLASMTIVFKLYDSAGNMVGNAYATGQGLGPGENWRFVAPAAIKFYNAEVVQVLAN